MSTEASKMFVSAYEHYTHGLTGLIATPYVECDECLKFDDNYADEDEWYEYAMEASFSWSACDTCGSSLGGDRHVAHGWSEELKRWIHLDVCVDCLLYMSNGQLPEEWG